MIKYEVNIKGITPLVMNAPNLVNPFYKLYKEHKEITSKRKKSDEELENLSYISFYSSIYFDEEIGIHIPVKCIRGAIWAAAKTNRGEGKNIKSVVFEEAIGIPLSPYENKTPNDLWVYEDKNKNRPFIFIEQLRIQKAMVSKARAMFHKWSLKFNLFKDSDLNFDKLKLYLEIAGKDCGLCELRPQKGVGNYGKFEIVSINEV